MGRETILQTLRRVVRAEGVRRGLYRGWGPAVLRGLPANGALLLGVEYARRSWDWVAGA